MPKLDIPDNTEAIHNLGNFIMSYQPYQNAFLSALVNRIGLVLVTSKMWNNPWAAFKRGRLEFGETVEEIFVNIAKPHSFDPYTAESEFMKREIPDVRSAFHTMNFQKFYKVTVSNDQLRQAFLAWQGITDLIAKIVDSLYTAMEYDEYTVMKYMVCREILNGGVAFESASEVSTANMKAIITKLRGMSSKLEFLSDNYNRANVKNATPRADQYIIVDADFEAMADVEVLASAFNMDKTTFLGHLIIVDSFSVHDTDRLEELFLDDSYTEFTETEIGILETISAFVASKDWWMVFDNLQQMTENYNGQGLYWQYYYHTWKTFSVSPFANAIVFSSATNAITAVEVSPETANVSQGSNLTLTATVTGTGIFSQKVKWSLTGATKDATAINEDTGVLYIAPDEPVTGDDGTPLTVTATSVMDSTKTDTAAITVVAG